MRRKEKRRSVEGVEMHTKEVVLRHGFRLRGGGAYNVREDGLGWLRRSYRVGEDAQVEAGLGHDGSQVCR